MAYSLRERGIGCFLAGIFNFSDLDFGSAAMALTDVLRSILSTSGRFGFGNETGAGPTRAKEMWPGAAHLVATEREGFEPADPKGKKGRYKGK
jgi:hypothetical protein